ncbi:MAG: tol-pal system protein YbgF, partial [Xanthomonadales bacterium]
MVRRFSGKSLMVSLVLTIIFSAPASAQNANQTVITNLVIQVQELQDEVRSLRGQLEEQSRELKNLKRRQRDQYLDLDQRLSDIRSSQPATFGRPGTAATPAQGRTVIPPAEDTPEVRAPLTSRSSVTGIGQPVAQNQTPASSAVEEKAAYNQAFQALKDLRYADAAEKFQSFLDRYSDSEYSDNAQYWLGESYYVTRNYDIALTAFQELMDRYPDSPKVPDALLKMGYTHYELKQWNSARAALTQVQESYPDTTLARLAESRLRGMRME